MKLVQRILSHGLLITFLVGGALLFLYRAELFPEWFAGNNDEIVETQAMDGNSAQVTASGDDSGPLPVAPVVTPVPEPVAAGNSAADLPPMAGGSNAAGLPPMAEAEVPGVDAVQVSRPAPVEAKFPDPLESAGAMPQAKLPPQYRPVPERAAPAERERTDAAWSDVTQPRSADTAAPDQFRPLEQKQPAAVSADQAAAPAVEDAEVVLATARNAYWRKDIEAAEKSYVAAARLAPQRPEIQGELGNLYFSQGRWSEAADAYEAAADLFLRQGDRAQASGLLRVIKGLDGEKARALAERIGNGND